MVKCIFCYRDIYIYICMYVIKQLKVKHGYQPGGKTVQMLKCQ